MRAPRRTLLVVWPDVGSAAVLPVPNAGAFAEVPLDETTSISISLLAVCDPYIPRAPEMVASPRWHEEYGVGRRARLPALRLVDCRQHRGGRCGEIWPTATKPAAIGWDRCDGR